MKKLTEFWGPKVSLAEENKVYGLQTQKDGLSEYELQRQRKIQHNRQVLASLGIEKFPQHQKNTTIRGKRASAKRPLPITTPRGSSRLKNEPLEDAREDSCQEKEQQQSQFTYENSKIQTYLCADTSTAFDNKSSLDANTIVFKEQKDSKGHASYNDSQLKRIYSISFNRVTPSLVAAGGHQGRASIYGVNDPEGTGDPIMSFRAHRGWISSVSFDLTKSKDRPILTTTSNDASIRLWDISRSAIETGSPLELSCCDDIHASGIFSMDIHQDAVFTASKDRTVVFSQLREDQIALVKRFDDLHESVVKSVAVRSDGDIFGSCGNDRLVQITDKRTGKNTLTIDNPCFTTALNSVSWHPTNEYFILTAGFDSEFFLFDIRSTKLQVFHQCGVNRRSKIYHPLFINDGKSIVVNGAGSKQLSVYSTATGEIQSSGLLSHEPNCIKSYEQSTHARTLAVGTGTTLSFYNY